MFGNYAKLVGAIAGNLVGILIVWLATQGLAECTAIDIVETCSVLGFTQPQVTAAVLAAFNTAFVYFFPPNRLE